MEIILRAGWGARPAEGSAALRKIQIPAPQLWVHHTVTPVGPDEKAILRQIQQGHISRAKQNGWKTQDIAYSFVVFPTGNIYEGRGFGFYGNHTQDHNTKSHGVAFAGDYRTSSPTLKSLDACRWLIYEGRRKGFIVPGGSLPSGGHRDVANTACPGARLYDRLDYLRQVWEEDVTPEEVRKIIREELADIDYTVKNIPDPAGGPGRVALHAWAHHVTKQLAGGTSAAQIVEAVKAALREGTA